MISLLLYWVITALALLLCAYIIPGIEINGFIAALLATLVMGLINVSLKPILNLLTLPINLLTLGLFALVINALMFMLVGWLVPGFEVANFLSAFLGSILLTILVSLMNGIQTGLLSHR